MAMMSAREQKVRWLWLALFAAFMLLGTGRWAVPVAAWLVGVFGLRFYRTYRRPISGYVWLSLAAYAASTVAWWGATLNYKTPEIDLVTGLFSAPIAMLPFAVDRWVLGRHGRRSAWSTVVFPLAMTGLAFPSLALAPWGSFGAMAYSQYGWLPIMQFGALFGLWGFEFLIAWFASVVNHAWEAGFRWSHCSRAVLVYGGVLVLVLGFGFGRLWLSPSGDTEVRVIGLTVDPDINQIVDDRDDPRYEAVAAAQHEQFLTRTVAAAQRGADVVVWPELAGSGDREQIDALIQAGSSVAAEHGIYLVMHTITWDDDPDLAPRNEMRIIAPDGEVALTHEKYAGNLEKLYGGSGSREITAIETPFGTFTGIVCWDADFPDTVTQVGRLDADLMFVSAKDWPEVREIHAEMATFRAVENGVSLFRQTATGVSLATDAYGRVLNYADSYDGIFEQDVRVPLDSTATLYPEIRDAFGWAAVLGLIAMLVAARITRRTPAMEPVAPPATPREVGAASEHATPSAGRTPAVSQKGSTPG